MRQASLPIDGVLDELIRLLRGSAAVVLRAPTGSGKTTRVPPALLDAGLAGERQVVVVEPRRVAARAAARWIADQRGAPLGDEVGYRVRFDERVGPRTRIHFVTDGVLLRMLQADAFLDRVGVVVLDEFHERRLHVDLALGMIRRVQQTVRPDLKLVVMSATIAAGAIARYLGDCPTIDAEGTTHAVSIRYQPLTQPVAGASTWSRGGSERRFEPRVAAALAELVSRTVGDVLVFLPGVAEIRRSMELFEPAAARLDLAVMPLYGDLPPEQQDAVLEPCARRKVVLATNVAETSLTIPGITAVLDTGLARVLRWDAGAGLDRLVLGRISRAAADQRAGRAGRTAPGTCVRLWSERDQQGRPEQDDAEIRRVDLSGALLQLLCWGERDLAAFPWFEPPAAGAIERGLDLLRRLGAIDGGAAVTQLGQAMARLPVHPRIARLLIEGHRRGVGRQAALAAALLAERDPFLRERPAGGMAVRRAAHRAWCDVADRVHALEELERSRRVGSTRGRLHEGAARWVLQARDQLVQLVRSNAWPLTAGPAAEPDMSRKTARGLDEALPRVLLAAFPDRLARRREPLSPRGVMVGGRGVRIGDRSAVFEPELFLCVEVDAGETESLVRLASGIERDWLPADRVATRQHLSFDWRTERVVGLRQTCYEDLVLEECPVALPDDEQVAAMLAGAAAQALDRVFPASDAAIGSFLARVHCLREWMPECQVPAFDESTIRAVLPVLCLGCRSFDELRRARWLDGLRSRLTPLQLQTLERELPERLAVPSGSRIAVRYTAGQPPVLAARIQELFGLIETPRIAAGRVPVVLELLAPNLRPQQVTQDLRSFWENVYPQVRQELRRRYPKHSWPEDPWTAAPERRPRRR
jgi:ATP-dependent helicase HrpB